MALGIKGIGFVISAVCTYTSARKPIDCLKVMNLVAYGSKRLSVSHVSGKIILSCFIVICIVEGFSVGELLHDIFLGYEIAELLC